MSDRSANPSTLAGEGGRLGLSRDESRQIVDGVLTAIPGALELARQDVADVPSGRAIADTIIANLRTISPVYPKDGLIMLTGGEMRRPSN